jgi:hypothetical protein
MKWVGKIRAWFGDEIFEIFISLVRHFLIETAWFLRGHETEKN